jgi:hypothetical protein
MGGLVKTTGSVRYFEALMASRLTAALLVFALVGVSAAPCAGWESTAKARHDCCVEGQCPDQIEAESHSGSHPGGVTQAQADQCCANSEQQNQQRSAQFAGATFLLLPPLESVVIAAADITPPEQSDPSAVPVPSPPGRLHLLYSVFLV